MRRTHVSALYRTLLDGGGRAGRPLSATTVRLVHRVLHKALADAVAAAQLPANPLAGVRPPRMDLYSHRVDRLQRDAASRIEAIVAPSPALPGAPAGTG